MDKSLQQDIESCVNSTQESIDINSAKAISNFTKKTRRNKTILDDISKAYILKDETELSRVEELTREHISKIDALESRIQHLEKLCDELEEFEKEVEVKHKLQNKRITRTD